MNVVTQFPAARNDEGDLRFQATFEAAAIGIAICRLDGRILEANPALSRMLGYSPQELAGTYAGELFPELHRTGILNGFSPAEPFLIELMRGERTSFESEKLYRRKDGSNFWGHLTVSLARDPRHQPASLIAVLADASERKRAEEHLREAEKLEIIGRLAAGVAHDFNNLLTGILLYCDLIASALGSKRRAQEGPERQGFANDVSAKERLASDDLEKSRLCGQVEDVRLAVEQGAALTQQLLAVARKQPAVLRPVLINEIVVSTKNLLQRLIGEQIELVTALDSGAGLVLADAAQLRQILLNLVLNARDALPQGGKIRVITRAAEFPAALDPAAARPAVSLTVQDNGFGMDAETRSRMFEPFFTAKKKDGTGLGLATVQRIVTEAGGTIEVESKPGRGTSIELLFPLASPGVANVFSERQ